MSWVYREPYRRPPVARLPPTAPSVGGPLTGTLGVTADSGTVAMSGATYYFADEFEGSTVDLSRWTVINRVEDLSNSELGCDEPGNITVTGNVLQGVSQRLGSPHSCGDAYTTPANKDYSSWMIQQRKGAFIYPSGGTAIIDIRAKMPGGTGLWPSIWMMGYGEQNLQPDSANAPGSTWPNDPNWEVDIAEFLANVRTSVNNQIHRNGTDNGGSNALGFDSSSQYAVYRLRWSLGQMVWQVDAEGGSGFVTLQTINTNVPATGGYLILNCAVGGTGGGAVTDATLPQTMFVDYVRVTADPFFTISDVPNPVRLSRIQRNVLLRL